MIVTSFLFLLEIYWLYTCHQQQCWGQRVHWKWSENKEAADTAACFPVMRFTMQYIICLKKTSWVYYFFHPRMTLALHMYFKGLELFAEHSLNHRISHPAAGESYSQKGLGFSKCGMSCLQRYSSLLSWDWLLMSHPLLETIHSGFIYLAWSCHYFWYPSAPRSVSFGQYCQLKNCFSLLPFPSTATNRVTPHRSALCWFPAVKIIHLGGWQRKLLVPVPSSAFLCALTDFELPLFVSLCLKVFPRTMKGCSAYLHSRQDVPRRTPSQRLSDIGI